MAEGKTRLRGLNSDEVAATRERDDLFQPVEAELTAFAGVQAVRCYTGHG